MNEDFRNDLIRIEKLIEKYKLNAEIEIDPFTKNLTYDWKEKKLFEIRTKEGGLITFISEDDDNASLSFITGLELGLGLYGKKGK